MNNYGIIYIGKIKESHTGTPLELFKEAKDIAESRNFLVMTNNPQFLEAIEVFRGDKKSIKIFLIEKNKKTEITFDEAYSYLGDIFQIINLIRFDREICNDLGYPVDEKLVKEEIQEYEEKVRKMIDY